MGALLDAAQSYVQARLSVIPIADMKTKRPSVRWSMYQEHCPPPADIARWFGPSAALAIVCGAVSGNLTVLDFDAHSDHVLVYDEYRAVLGATHPGLVDSLPLVQTQRGGLHLYFRAPFVEGNQKLATITLDATHVDVLIETRGQGGYVLAPPTPGYTLRRGDLAAIPQVTGAEYASLITTAKLFGRAAEYATSPAPASADEEKPGTLYNHKASIADVVRLLTKHGWHVAHTTTDGVPFLTRPGKATREGASGNVRVIDGVPVFYNFSTSTGDFAVKGYSPFQVLGILECKSDWSAAAKLAYKLVYPDPIPFTRPSQQNDSNSDAPPPEPDERPKPRLKLLSFADLLNRPKAEMMLGTILPRRGLGVMYSAPGVGKSFIALDWACRIAAGLAWFGQQVKVGSVIYVAAEGADGLTKRAKAWSQEFYNNEMVPNIHFIDHPIYPTHPETGPSLIEAIEYLQITDVVLVVLDTLARCNDGDENDTGDMGKFVNAIDLLRTKLDCHLLLLHHAGKDGNLRGNTQLPGAADVVIKLTEDKQEGKKIVTMSCEKMKDGSPFDTWRLLRREVILEDETSCVMTLAAGSAPVVSPAMHAILEPLSTSLEGLRRIDLEKMSQLTHGSFNSTVVEALKYGYIVKAGDNPTKFAKYVLTQHGNFALRMDKK